MDEFEKLKGLLEDSHILEIRGTSKRESICEFLIEKKGIRKSFILYCTDLGFWIGDEKDSDGVFSDLQQLFEDLEEHSTGHDFKNVYEAVNDPSMIQGFKCRKCKKKFLIRYNTIKASEYSKFFSTSKKRDQLAKILSESYIGNKDDLLQCLKNLRREEREKKS